MEELLIPVSYMLLAHVQEWMSTHKKIQKLIYVTNSVVYSPYVVNDYVFHAVDD